MERTMPSERDIIHERTIKVDRRPILLGMNPNGPRGTEALSPSVPGSAGYRLWKLSGLPLEVYLETFERRNLLPGPVWSPRAAAGAARRFLRTLPRGRPVIVLGELPRAALEKVGKLGKNFHFIPHPSGRCFLYNQREERAAAGRVMRSVAGLG